MTLPEAILSGVPNYRAPKSPRDVLQIVLEVDKYVHDMSERSVVEVYEEVRDFYLKEKILSGINLLPIS